MILTLCSPSSGDLAHAAWFFPDHRQKIFSTLPITGNIYFVLYLTGSLVFPDQDKFPRRGGTLCSPTRPMILTLCSPSSGDLAHAAWFFSDHRQKIFRTLPITGKKYFVLYLTGSLVFPDHRQKIFRTLPITGKKSQAIKF